jgi:hypothetical protein
MLNQTVTHYAPWDASDDFAYCGVYVSDPMFHSPQPTCPTCAAKLAAECAIDEAIETAPWPLDADEARAELDLVLNAGVPAERDVLSIATGLTRRLAVIDTIDTDQFALVRLVREAQIAVKGGTVATSFPAEGRLLVRGGAR